MSLIESCEARTRARPKRIEHVEGDEERFGKLERVHELWIILPQTKTYRDLAGEPGDLEGAPGEEMALGLSNMKHRLLDALGNLILIQNYGTIEH